MKQTSFEHDLLRSARLDDQPAADRREKNRAAVMQAAGFAAAGAAAVAAKGLGGSAALTPALHPAAGGAFALAKTTLLAKVLVGLSLVVVVGGSIAVVRRESAPEPAPARSSAMSPTEPARLPPPPAVASSEISASPVASSASSASSRPLTGRSGKAATRSSVDALADEACLLEDARACIARSDAACAAAKLEEHETRYPRGALSDEAMLLRIDLAEARGDRAAVVRLAKALLATSPAGPYARRAKALLSDSE